MTALRGFLVYSAANAALKRRTTHAGRSTNPVEQT
jgi:hypothetical protein